jgi:uncharacterized membrane-anchored protein YhcB (DUF1043 family)
VTQKDNQVEIGSLIEALKRERERLVRFFALLGMQRAFLDDVSKDYFDLWRLKSERGIELLQLSPYHRQILDYLFGYDDAEQQIRAIERELRDFINQGRYLTLIEMEGVLQTIDAIVQRLENQQAETGKRGASTLKLKSLVGKVMRIGGGIALIGMDLPDMSWPSVVSGSILILTTSLSDE